MTAVRAKRGSRSTFWMSVVFPLPRKPVTTDTGVASANSSGEDAGLSEFADSLRRACAPPGCSGDVGPPDGTILSARPPFLYQALHDPASRTLHLARAPNQDPPSQYRAHQQAVVGPDTASPHSPKQEGIRDQTAQRNFGHKAAPARISSAMRRCNHWPSAGAPWNWPFSTTTLPRRRVMLGHAST